MAKFAAANGPAAIHIYIYMHMHAVELLSGPSLAFLIVINWAKFVFLNTVCVKTL